MDREGGERDGDTVMDREGGERDRDTVMDREGGERGTEDGQRGGRKR